MAEIKEEKFTIDCHSEDGTTIEAELDEETERVFIDIEDPEQGIPSVILDYDQAEDFAYTLLKLIGRSKHDA